MKREVQVGHVYRHFKGTLYKVICICKDSEDLSLKVVYEDEFSKKIWVRDKEAFLSLVDKDKYPNANQKYRFELVD